MGLAKHFNEGDGKYSYIRVRMRKLVKFEEDIHDLQNGQNRKKKRKKRKNKHSRKNKSSNNILSIEDDEYSKDENDYPAIWRESHFSRPVRICMFYMYY